MEQAARTGVRHAMRRALGRALLVVGGAVGGTVVAWAVASGTADAAPLHHSAAPLGGVLAPATADTASVTKDVTRGIRQVTEPLATPDGVRGLIDPAALPALPAVPALPATPAVPRLLDGGVATDGLLPAATTVLQPLAGPVRSASAGLGPVITPARANLPVLTNVLRPTNGTVPNTSAAPEPIGGDSAHGLPSKEPMRSGLPAADTSATALAPAGPVVDEHSVRSGSERAAGGQLLAGRDGPEQPAPLTPFGPLPGAPALTTSIGQTGAAGDAGWSAAPSHGYRGDVDGAVAKPRHTGAGHRVGISAQQPGVTPD